MVKLCRPLPAAAAERHREQNCIMSQLLLSLHYTNTIIKLYSCCYLLLLLLLYIHTWFDDWLTSDQTKVKVARKIRIVHKLGFNWYENQTDMKILQLFQPSFRTNGSHCLWIFLCVVHLGVKMWGVLGTEIHCWQGIQSCQVIMVF